MKQLRLFAAWLCIVLLFTLLPVSAAERDVFATSRNPDNYVLFSIDGDTLTVEGKIICENLVSLWLRTQDITVLNEYSKIIDAASGQYFKETLSLSGITRPTCLSVYTKQEPGDGFFWSFIWDSVQVEPFEDGFRFVTSPIAGHNQAVRSVWLNPADGLKNADTVPASVKAKSDEIVGDLTDDYAKVFALHRWVAENIHYDYDYYLGASRVITYEAADVLISRRSVCEGYANLLAELIRAQGIPAVIVSTYAAGISVKDFDSSAPGASEANHAHVEAWADGRWVTMDPTWDSNNTYENGQYIIKEPSDFNYFDPSPENFALDHKLIDRPAAAKEDIPADWAKPEVLAALSAGLIPYSLQKDYESPISRLDFCRMLMHMLCIAEDVSDPSALLQKKGISESASPFADIDDPAVTAANKLGIVNGKGAGTFDPAAGITRQEAAAMLMRAARLLGIEAGSEPPVFADTASSPEWAMAGISFTASLISDAGTRVMGGTGNGCFGPEDAYTVQQSILTLWRLFDCR